MNNPYLELGDKSFWKKAVVETTPDSLGSIYSKKFNISKLDNIATAGSCFAQHVSRGLKKNGFRVINKEGSDYSANYGNIYTVAQLLQLTKECIGESHIKDIAWERDGKYIDALRPGATTSPLTNRHEILEQRSTHLRVVKAVLQELDVFIFTLGLTEAWIRKEDETVFPSAPGVIAGVYEPNKYEFKNYDFNSIVLDFEEFINRMTALRQGKSFKIILTVSPVPLTATASKEHVLVANTYSKSTLRAVAAYFSQRDYIDYFPSYEIVTNPRYSMSSYDSNLRTVKQVTVDNVMKYFFLEHKPLGIDTTSSSEEFDLHCEEQILDMYADLKVQQESDQTETKKYHTEVIGDSHMNSFVKALRSSIGSNMPEQFCIIDRRVLKYGITPEEQIKSEDIYDISDSKFNSSPKFIQFTQSATEQIEKFKGSERRRLIFVGGLMGDNFLRFHGNFTESESPKIPIVQSIDEISELYQSKVRARVDYVKRLLEKAIISLGEQKVKWLVSPLPSESAASIRFGSEYINSKSQLYYNIYWNNIINTTLEKYIHLNIIILQPSNTISQAGFSYDKYAFKPDTKDVHLNKEYYEELISNQLLE